MKFLTQNCCTINIQTLSLRPDAAIIGIGATSFRFDVAGYDTFHRNITLQSVQSFNINKDTVQFWRERPKDLLRSIKEDNVTLVQACKDLTDFFRNNSVEVVFSRSIDNLRLVFDEYSLPLPWEFYNEYDLRTIQNMMGKKIEHRFGMRNYAHDASINEMAYLTEIFAGVRE